MTAVAYSDSLKQDNLEREHTLSRFATIAAYRFLMQGLLSNTRIKIYSKLP